MKHHGGFATGSLLAAVPLFVVVVIHMGFAVLPAFFLMLGLASYLWSGRKAMLLFLFLLPLANSTPDLFFNGYPFNYLAMPLFFLAGVLCASRLKRERLATDFPGRGPYLLFLALLVVSALFVFLRWSNLGLSALAFLRDTPVAPSMDRVSFACIFPAVTLALFALAPWAAFLLRHWRLGAAEAFVPLKAGFFLSFLLALAQKWIDPDLLSQSWWGVKMKQLNGGFSDFNAFGFFAGAMFLWQALELIGRLSNSGRVAEESRDGPWPWRLLGGGSLIADLMFLAVALAAVFVSGCRTAFLFVLAGLLRLFFSRRPSGLTKAAAASLLAVLLLVAGGTLGRRLWNSATQAARLSSSADLGREVDRISNGRLTMLRDAGVMIGRFPASGVGAGNFLFYLKYLHHGEKAWLDLPLNQYLLFFSETGLTGGLVFLLFLATVMCRLAPGAARFMLAVMAVALFFNNFFWFPEALLLFWIVFSIGPWPAARKSKNGGAWAAAVLLFFVAANVVQFQALHPRTLAQERGTRYDYGFSYPEQGNGREFRWSGEKAGLYIHLDTQGRSRGYRLYCGAPLPHLPADKQSVDIYWRGKPFQRLAFRHNGEMPLLIEDQGAREGFLEFRVHPVFNLKKMGLGSESRDLGIQVSGPEG
jgi:hypothetical protein